MQEGRFDFDFTAAISVERLDEQIPGRRQPQGMQLVDFVVEELDRWLLIEVKDPGNPQAQRIASEQMLKQLREYTLINEILVPKARDSYTFLHLMERDSKPFIFVFFLGLGNLEFEHALLLELQERLMGRLMHEAAMPWKRRYISACVVVTEEIWLKHFPNYQLSEI